MKFISPNGAWFLVAQSAVPGHGAGEQPDPGPRLPGRDPRLAAFARDDAGDRCPPGAWTGMVLNELSGPQRRCADATDDELIGLLGRWGAQESWTVAAKLGVIRELLCRRALSGAQVRWLPCGLPDAWDEGVGHEVSAVLGISLQAADSLIQLAWDLLARIPRIGAALDDGVLDYVKAKIIAAETSVLDEEHLAAAEEMILSAGLAGKTPGQVARIAARAVVTVDPDGARRRREEAERENARIRFWRERAGTSVLAGYGLPTDAALQANANVNQRADEYKKAGLDGTMDQLRVLAYLDILNGTSAADRIAQAQAEADQAGGQAEAARAGAAQSDGRGQPGGPDGTNGNRHPGGEDSAGSSGPDAVGEDGLDDEDRPGADDPGDGPGSDDGPGDDSQDDDPQDDDGPGDDGPGGGGPGSGPDDRPSPDSGSGPAAGQPAPTPGPGLAARTNLTFPLATLLGLAERPGEGHGLGPLDPALTRQLAATAARNPHSQWCITITDHNGYAIGHGCAKPARTNRQTRQSGQTEASPPGSRDGPWAFTPHDKSGPPGGFGTWILTLPTGQQLTVKLMPVPVTDCDHRYESHAYQPNDTLRHLVQIRDGECTFPTCSRHARESDFEHATPYHKGGRTCACNAGARSRRCHKTKQSKGWKLTQPLPGWHQWTTPSGRIYTQGPMQYPA
jgi:hypothetical protein